MTTGKGAAASSSNKMKCKHDSDVVWIRYFVECQEYDIDEYIIYKISRNRHTPIPLKRHRINDFKEQILQKEEPYLPSMVF